MVTRSTDGSQPGTPCRGSSHAAHFRSSFIQIFGIILRRDAKLQGTEAVLETLINDIRQQWLQSPDAFPEEFPTDIHVR